MIRLFRRVLWALIRLTDPPRSPRNARRLPSPPYPRRTRVYNSLPPPPPPPPPPPASSTPPPEQPTVAPAENVEAPAAASFPRVHRPYRVRQS
jgi:hypothetical protein